MPQVSYSILWDDGSADGLWVAKKHGWIGLALACPRSSWPKARGRPEFGRSGVYILMSGASESASVYIGEADDLKKRLNYHYGKSEWTRVVAFTSTDASLNKAHCKSLESRLIGLAQQAGRAQLVNDQPSLPSQLGEVDQAIVTNFLAEMLPLYRLLGVSAFTPVADPAGIPGLEPGSMLYLTGGGASTIARGQEVHDGFAVFEAQVAVKATPSLQPFAANLRESLISTGVLVLDEDHLRLTKPYVFASPSTAASVIRGYHVDGRTAWKDEHGVTLKQHQEAVAANPSG